MKTQRDVGLLLIETGVAWQNCLKTLQAVWDFIDKATAGPPAPPKGN